MITQPEFRSALGFVPRPLPIALAHRYAALKPGDPMLETLNRIFDLLSFRERLLCRTELHECRQAQAGRRLAEVATR